MVRSLFKFGYTKKLLFHTFTPPWVLSCSILGMNIVNCPGFYGKETSLYQNVSANQVVVMKMEKNKIEKKK